MIYRIADGKVSRVEVKPGMRNTVNVEILGGLAEGDEVAVGKLSNQIVIMKIASLMPARFVESLGELKRHYDGLLADEDHGVPGVPVRVADTHMPDAERRRAVAESRASIEYLEKELATTITVDTRNAISRLMEAQIKQRMLANVTVEYAFRVIDRALAPDLKDMIRPKRLLLVAFGFVLGLLVGVIVVLLRRDA